MARTFFKNISNYGKVVPNETKTIDSVHNATGQHNGSDCGHPGSDKAKSSDCGGVTEMAERNVADRSSRFGRGQIESIGRVGKKRGQRVDGLRKTFRLR